MNQVDLQYRTELRELNQLTFDRFDARVGERLAELKTSLLWWMFGLWTGNVVATAALVLAILKAAG